MSAPLTRRKKIVRRTAPSGAIEQLHPVLSRILMTRDVKSRDEIDHRLARLLAPDRLSGIEDAVTLLVEALEADANILFVGDFDADGATSCALGILALRGFGASNVDYLVPNRFEFGYGLSPEIVGVAAGRQPDLIVTVDNGISSHAGVAVARELGMSVLVTDHHLPGTHLPPADAIVNPNVNGDGFASKHLAGVGVLFYVMMALRQRLREMGWFGQAGRDEPNLAEFLDIVAVGTVADVVALDRNNRILVAQGLARINAGRCRPGIRALLDVGGCSRAVTATDLGFVVGPRLNAAGRLDDMSGGIECLLAEDFAQAREWADRLHALNAERREMQANMENQATQIIERLMLDDGPPPAGLCLFQEDWHQGLVGLIAARMRERTNRPVIAFAPADGEELKASARSVPGLHIRDLLDGIATRHPDLLVKFGGHAMAAGLSLKRSQLADFSKIFAEAVAATMGTPDAVESIYSDGSLDDSDLDIGFADLLRQTTPWGQGFPEPMFDDEFEILEHRVIGGSHVKFRVRRVSGFRTLEAMAFRLLDEQGDVPNLSRAHMAYRLDVNEYQGQRTAQLIIEYMEPC